ncbi:MAG: aminotransferase class III-fold pyridoxal phosphate-dependent enzyme, partial [Thermogemmatispora sp.]
EERLVENAARMGEYWHEKLQALCQKYDFIANPRGIGLMRAVEVKYDLAPAIVDQALKHGLLLNNLGNATLRMVPPLILTRADIDEAAQRLDRALEDVSLQRGVAAQS